MSGSHFDSGPSLMGRVAICLAIAANALSAGGIFIFPLLSPALASLLKLSQPQLTTIVLAGMIGQYPFSAFVGKLFDKYGPASCSLVAAALFGLSFHFFAAEVTNGTTVQTPQTSASLFRNLVALFLLSGLGTVFSYFSAVFAATKTFPLYPGIASGTSMALFGLSPLLLTTIAASKFVDPETGLLNIVSFMEFLAIYTTSIHILASIALRHVPKHDTVVVESQQENAEPTEQSTLLPPKPIPTSPGSEGADSLLELNGQSTISLLQDPNFWLLGLYCLLVFGAVSFSHVFAALLKHIVSVKWLWATWERLCCRWTQDPRIYTVAGVDRISLRPLQNKFD
ncbi:hypothetical protein AX16_003735 [Volvariella volvacea WC 439]|nr:hypothetical protein AX16_003735 [Volvariella volvacea WC 439]